MSDHLTPAQRHHCMQNEANRDFICTKAKTTAMNPLTENYATYRAVSDPYAQLELEIN